MIAVAIICLCISIIFIHVNLSVILRELKSLHDEYMKNKGLL